MLLNLGAGSISAGDLPWPCRNGPFHNGSATDATPAACPSNGMKPPARTSPGRSTWRGLAFRLRRSATGDCGSQRPRPTASSSSSTRSKCAHGAVIVHHKLDLRKRRSGASWATGSTRMRRRAACWNTTRFMSISGPMARPDSILERRRLSGSAEIFIAATIRGPGSSPIVWQNLLDPDVRRHRSAVRHGARQENRKNGLAHRPLDQLPRPRPGRKAKTRGRHSQGLWHAGRDGRGGPHSDRFSRLAGCLRLRRRDW